MLMPLNSFNFSFPQQNRNSRQAKNVNTAMSSMAFKAKDITPQEVYELFCTNNRHKYGSELDFLMQ